MKKNQVKHCAFSVLAFLLLVAGSARGQINSGPLTAIQLDGSTGYVSTSVQFNNPQAYTIAIWFNTTTTRGGRLLGFGTSQTGLSTGFDRHLYMDDNGHILFGTFSSTFQVVSNTAACNDGAWHQAAATFSPATGMNLYIDGALAASNPSFTVDQTAVGWWRIGYDNLNGWPNAPASDYFAGTIDEVQIWSTVLTANQIQSNLHLFRNGTETGLVSYWQFDYGDGTQEPDVTSTANTANFQGGVSWVNSTAPIGLPQVQNQASLGAVTNAVTLNGLVTPNFQTTGAWFQYGLTTTYTGTTPQVNIGASNSSAVPVSLLLGGLQTGTQYHFQLVATNSAGTNYGSDFTVSTLTPSPSLTPLPAGNLTGSGVTFNGAVNPNGLDTQAWFEWGATTTCGNSTPPTDAGSGGNPVTVSARIFNAPGAEVFHYHLVASNAYGRFTGPDQIMQVPLIGLFGNNPMTTPFGAPFQDPGYLLAPTTPLSVAAGRYFCLAANGDGSVTGWGDNAFGESTPPAGLNNVVGIAAGETFSVALRNDGTVVAWGDNSAGQTNVPSSVTNAMAVAAGAEFAMALQGNGTVIAWGDNRFGETNVPAGLSNVVAIAAGGFFGLALQSDGNIVGWGENNSLQTTPPSGLTNVAAIAAGGDFSLAVLNDGTVQGWGSSEFGETSIPLGLSNVVAISVGGYFGMVLQDDGTVTGWGSDPGLGQVPVGWDLAENSRSVLPASGGGPHYGTPLAMSDTLVAIAAGYDCSVGFDGSGDVTGGGNATDGDLSIPSGLNVPSYTINVSGTVNVNVPGVYTLTYTVSNFLGAVDTVTRTVVVAPPPAPTGFAISKIAPGQCALQFSANTIAGFTVLAATNLALPLPQWQALGPAVVSGALFHFTDTNAAGLPQRFYMLRSP